jgi:D-3-phosphoglycerate dehydrogenase
MRISFDPATAAIEPAGPVLTRRMSDLEGLVVITPHIGAQTVEAVDRMGSAATADVIAVLSGSDPAHPVRPQEEQ